LPATGGGEAPAAGAGRAAGGASREDEIHVGAAPCFLRKHAACHPHARGHRPRAALFVAITGVTGMTPGEPLLRFMSLHSTLVRDAVFSVGVHRAGMAKACEIGSKEGGIGSLAIVLIHLLNVKFRPAWTVFL